MNDCVCEAKETSWQCISHLCWNTFLSLDLRQVKHIQVIHTGQDETETSSCDRGGSDFSVSLHLYLFSIPGPYIYVLTYFADITAIRHKSPNGRDVSNWAIIDVSQSIIARLVTSRPSDDLRRVCVSPCGRFTSYEERLQPTLHIPTPTPPTYPPTIQVYPIINRTSVVNPNHAGEETELDALISENLRSRCFAKIHTEVPTAPSRSLMEL